MKELIVELFGEGEHLNVLQMCMRSIVIFFICLLFIRISGRRSFSLHMPFDNVMSVLIGSVLSQAVVGDSPFFPTIAAAGTLAIIHRICGWLGLRNESFGNIMKGKAMTVYKNGELIEKNMNHCMVTKKDIMEGIRQNINTDSFQKVNSIIIERNGEISVIEKEEK